MKVAIITANTQEYKDKVESTAGAVIQRMVEQISFQTVFNQTLPQDRAILTTVMNRLIDGHLVDLIITTGGTGVREEDCVPEATLDAVDRLLPGIPEAVRAYNIRYSKRNLLDRSVAGMRKKTLIVNLPDTAKVAKESLEYILPELVHVVETMGLTN